MSKLFPFRRSPDLEDREPRLVDLDDDVADEVFDALGSRTARSLLLELHEEPRPPSELAEAVDTSIQNVQYHLTKLEAADLVTVVDTWYSETGTEMDVYAPADDGLVVFAGEDPERSLRDLLGRLVGAMGLLGLGALVVAFLVRERRADPTFQVATGGANASYRAGEAVATGGDPVVAALSFVCGGLVALAALALVGRLLN